MNMPEEDIVAVALEGYRGIQRTTKKDFDTYINFAAKTNGLLLDYSVGAEINLRQVRNNIVIIYNMFESNTARKILFHFSTPQSAVLLNTILVYLSYSNDPNIDSTLMERLENG